jgi:hypothetical protein
MSKFRPTTARSVVADLKAFANYLSDPDPDMSDLRQEIASWLNRKLDELHGDDAFGTEGQCDPRGDHRG